MKPTTEQIEEARKRGIVPGAEISCASNDRDEAIVPPHMEWEVFTDGGIGFKWEA